MRLFFVFVFSKRMIPYILMVTYVGTEYKYIHNNINLTNDSKLRG